MIDPHIMYGDKQVQISGYIDQGGATSENNTAIQININIHLPENMNNEQIRCTIASIFDESKRALTERGLRR